MLVDVLLVLDELVPKLLAKMIRTCPQLGQPIDGVHHQMKSIHVVEYRHVKWGGNRALFFVAAHMQAVVIVTAVCESMDEPGVAMECENHRLSPGKQRIEIVVAQTMRMFGLRLQLHEVDHVDDAHF